MTPAALRSGAFDQQNQTKHPGLAGRTSQVRNKARFALFLCCDYTVSDCCDSPSKVITLFPPCLVQLRVFWSLARGSPGHYFTSAGLALSAQEHHSSHSPRRSGINSCLLEFPTPVPNQRRRSCSTTHSPRKAQSHRGKKEKERREAKLFAVSAIEAAHSRS